MLPIAIISDVHGNVDALEKVLADIRRQGIETILNLGDVVGYGPDPDRCIDLVESHCEVNLCGNHDWAVLHEAEGFNAIAQAAVDYVRNLLQAGGEDPDTQRRWRFLENLETVFEGPGFEAMHASPRQPINEYVLPSDPEMDPFKIRDIFAAMKMPIAFIGHTHFPGIIEEGRDRFLVTGQFEHCYTVGERKILVNVGSVGQPRDMDVRSCYVVYDGQTITYRRVEYDVESVVRKVQDSCNLPESCGTRLREGR